MTDADKWRAGGGGKGDQAVYAVYASQQSASLIRARRFLMANGVNKIHTSRGVGEGKKGGRLEGTQKHDGGYELMVRWCVNCWQGRCCEFDYRRRDPKNGCSPNLQQPLKKRSCWLTRFVSITFFVLSVSPDLHIFLLTACPPVTRPSSASLQADLATQHLSLFLMCIQKKVRSLRLCWIKSNETVLARCINYI